MYGIIQSKESKLEEEKEQNIWYSERMNFCFKNVEIKISGLFSFVRYILFRSYFVYYKIFI